MERVLCLSNFKTCAFRMIEYRAEKKSSKKVKIIMEKIYTKTLSSSSSFFLTLTFKVRFCEKNIPTSLNLKTDFVLKANLPYETIGLQSLYVVYML